jgi:hypothetical protein
MRFLRYLLLFVLMGGTLPGLAQSQDTAKTIRKSSALSLSYNSSLIYPGLRAGLELPMETIRLIKLKKSGEKKYFVKDRFITVNLGWYHHPGYHDNVYLTSGWTMRRTNARGFFTEFTPEAGISRTFLGGTTYVVDGNGDVSIKKGAGYFYGLVSAGGGIGYDFEKTKQLPLSLFSKLNLLMMFPYNSTIYLRPALEIGVIYRPAHFLRMKVRSKDKKR